MISRRMLLASVLGVITAPLAAETQPRSGKVWRIGYLWATGPVGADMDSTDRHFLDAFRLGLRDHGYVEGQNVTIEARWAEGRTEPLRHHRVAPFCSTWRS